jgi:hypothetical protein
MGEFAARLVILQENRKTAVTADNRPVLEGGRAVKPFQTSFQGYQTPILPRRRSMKSSAISFVSAVAIAAAMLTVNTASAGCGGGGYKIRHHHHAHHVHYKHFHHKHVYHGHYHRPHVHYYAKPEIVVAAPVIPHTPAAHIAVTAEEKPRTQVPIGSVLLLNGQPLGGLPGSVQLEIDGREAPVQILEWTESFVKIRLPMLPLTGPVDADIDVVRADGTVASCSPLELLPISVQPPVEVKPVIPQMPLTTGPLAVQVAS